MNFPESLLTRKPPEYLYHYTSISGLSGIVESRSLWATDISYLNDTQEFRYAISLLVEELSKRDLRCKKPIIIDLYKNVLNLPWSISIPSICVFSLSEQADLLSQWRGYCPSGTGYSVGFKSDLLIPLLGEQGLLLAPCIYERSDQKELIDSLLTKTEELSNSGETDIKKTLESFRVAFNQIAALIKHPKFVEEIEWRIVTKDVVGINRLETRVGKSLLIPYLNIKIDPPSPHSFPINKIIVGPSPEQELAMNSLPNLFAKNGFGSQITPSEIPYRNM